MNIYTIKLFEKIKLEYDNIEYIKIKNRCIICINNSFWIIRKIFKNFNCIYENEYDYKDNFFLVQFLIDRGENTTGKLYNTMILPDFDDTCEIQVDTFSKLALKYICENN